MRPAFGELSSPASRSLTADFAAALAGISKLSGLSVCLHDLADFSREDGRALLPKSWYQHRHPFCRRVKARSQPDCLRDDFERANRRAGTARRVFVKRCHAGVIEAVVPVVIAGSHAGTIFLGPAVERGRKPPASLLRLKASETSKASAKEVGASGLPVRSRRELLEVGRLLAVLAGYAAEAGGALLLQRLARAARTEPVRRAMELAEKRSAEPLSVADAAREVYLSPSRFAHVFSAEAGMSFHQYLACMRVEKAKGLLAHSSLNIGEIAARTGFCNQNYFAAVFRERTGLAPGEYRRRRQESIEI
jgi:AraC-like DNA-binding protein